MCDVCACALYTEKWLVAHLWNAIPLGQYGDIALHNTRIKPNDIQPSIEFILSVSFNVVFNVSCSDRATSTNNGNNNWLPFFLKFISILNF